jgi:hypothetical protein
MNLASTNNKKQRRDCFKTNKSMYVVKETDKKPVIDKITDRIKTMLWFEWFSGRR